MNIELDDNVLTISGERKAEHEERKEGYYRVERSSGSFARSLTLPEGVDADAVKASFDNGVLEVRVPKPEAAQAAQGRDLGRRRCADDDRGRRVGPAVRDDPARRHADRAEPTPVPRRARAAWSGPFGVVWGAVA